MFQKKRVNNLSQYQFQISTQLNLSLMEIKNVPNLPRTNQQPVPPPNNPNENGAPLRPEKTVPKQIAERGSIKIWGDNPLNDCFIDLLRILRNQNQGVPFQEAILKSRFQKDIKSKQSLNLKQGIDLIGLYFQHLCKSQENNNSYVRNFQKKPHLGLTAEQLGFRVGIVLEQCPELDAFWAKIVNSLSEKLGTNKMAAFKCLRRYVRQQGIFTSLYEVKVEGMRMGPKQQSIKSFFKEQSSEYLIILSKLAQIYFQQFNAYMCSLVQIIQNNKYIGLKNIVIQQFKIINTIWEAYLYLSDQIKSGPANVGKNSPNQKLQKDIFIKKIQLFINFLRFFQTILQSCQEIDTILVNRPNFLKEYTQKFDKDIINFQKLNIWTNIDVSQFSKLITSVFILLFPFKDCATKEGGKANRIAEQVSSIQSEPLKLIKLLMSAYRFKPPQLSGTIKQFQQIIARGQWNAFDLNWKQWLGLFLRKFKEGLKSNNKQLTKHIIYLCKKVISSQFQLFFEESKPFYLQQISQFLTMATSSQYQSTVFNGVSILPICNKLMGRINKRFTFYVSQMLGEQTISNMFLSIISSLKIGLASRIIERSDRIVYVSHNQQPCFEQEIKFICRLIQLQADNIQQLQQSLFNSASNESYSATSTFIKPNPSAGLLLIIRLIQIFYAISPDTISEIKCLRYIIKAINSLFICQSTRNFVCIAFAVVESGKQNYAKSLKAITSRCYDYDTSSQIGRQSQKLRKALGFHINSILKISDTLDQYFPTTNQKEATHLYRRVNDFLQQQNFQMAYKLVQQMIEQQLFNSKAVQWFYQFIKLFQSNRQTSIDLDSIKHLLLKTRMKNETSREYFNLSLAINILNNGKIHEIILKMLTPIVKTQKSSNGRQKYFLGLANQQLEGFMTRNYTPQHANSFKYANRFYRLFKLKCNNNKQKIQLYGKISGSLSIIQTILRLNTQGNFPLLQKIQLNNHIIKSLFGEQPHMYSVKFKIKMKKTNQQKFRNSLFAPNQMIQKQLQNSVSLIHCIASYWDLQQRLNIDQTDHPSSLYKLKGHFSIDTELTSYLPDILYISQENILTDITKKAQTVGISTVAKIMENIIFLGQGKKLYFSILCRNYPIGKGLLASDSVSNTLTDFMQGILYASKRRQATYRQRQFVVELLSVFLQQKHFGEYIKAKIYDTKQALTKCRQMSSFLQSSRLTVQFLLFLNHILISDASESNIRFVKSCLVDPVEYGKKLFMHCQTRIGTIRKISEKEKKSKYATYVWCLEVREAAFCRMALFLFLGISSYIIANDHPSLASSLAKLILINSQAFLKKYTLELERDFGKKIEDLRLNQSIPAPEIKQQAKYSFLSNLQHLNAALLNSPFSLAENYLIQPWQIMQKYSKRDYKQLILGAYRDNSIKALYFSNESLVQYYYLQLSSIFQRGHQGLYDIKHQKSIKEIPKIILFNKQRAKNQLSCTQLMYDGENISTCCFRILRDIQKEVWEKQTEIYMKSSRDCAIITIIQIIKSVKNMIVQDSNLIPECNRTVDKLINYMKIQDQRINLSTKYLMIQAILDLTSTTINKRLKDAKHSKKSRFIEIFTEYFRRTEDCLDCILNEKSLNDFSKLHEEHLNIFLLLLLNMLQTEIVNIQMSISQNQEREYLENQYRSSLLEKIKSLFNKLLLLLQMPKISINNQVTIIKLFIKGFHIDSLGKYAKTVGLMRLLISQIFQKIEKICLKINEEDHFFISNLYQSLWQVTILNEIQTRKHICHLLKSCDKITAANLRKLSQIKTLADINQISQVLSVYGSLSLQENWRSVQYKDLLDSIFILIQQRPLKIQVENIVPQLGFEVKLSQKYFDKKSSKLSLFSIFSALSIFSMIKNYLFFSFTALRESPTINDLCNNTFNKGIIDDLSIDRLRESFGTIISFLQRFQLILKETDIQSILKILNYSFKQNSFLIEFQYRAFNFENYENKQDFFDDIVNTIGLLMQSVKGLEQIWERYDWKSTQNWRPNKQDLVKRKTKLLDSYCNFFKDKRQLLMSERLKKLQNSQRNLKTKTQF